MREDYTLDENKSAKILVTYFMSINISCTKYQFVSSATMIFYASN